MPTEEDLRQGDVVVDDKIAENGTSDVKVEQIRAVHDEDAQAKVKGPAAPGLAAPATGFYTPEEQAELERQKSEVLSGATDNIRIFDAGQVANDPILKFFEYGHLPPMLQQYSAPFGIAARFIITALPRNAERTVALRKLLEAKDAAVRAAL